MSQNNSPWIYQLNKERKIEKLSSDINTDIAIVGGGIAGISTAFFILKYTNKNIILLEKNKIARGATGHNAGQLVSYFERPYYEIVEEFGKEMAADGQQSIENAWEILDEIYEDAGLDINLFRFVGYDGFTSFEQLEEALKNNKARDESGLAILPIWVSGESPYLKSIPEKFISYYEVVSGNKINELLETEDKNYFSLVFHQKGVMNSALFTEEVAEYLRSFYSRRFSLFENTSVSKIVMKENGVLADTGNHIISSKKIILCTNGFENFQILNYTGLNINTKFHHLVEGVVARMSGYFEKLNKEPAAISYYTDNKIEGFDSMSNPYFYLTRRPYDHENYPKHNLICIGGPQHSIEDRSEYDAEIEYEEQAKEQIEDFVKKVYDLDPNKKIEYQFMWHGLMGYTPNRIRLIGAEPLNPHLLYNLGCNGVGILPSLYGGKRISKIIAGEILPASIFDPRNSQ